MNFSYPYTFDLFTPTKTQNEQGENVSNFIFKATVNAIISKNQTKEIFTQSGQKNTSLTNIRVDPNSLENYNLKVGDIFRLGLLGTDPYFLIKNVYRDVYLPSRPLIPLHIRCECESYNSKSFPQNF